MVSGGFDGEDPARVHQLLAETLDEAFDEIARIQEAARAGGPAERPTWPMIVLRTPKGWTCPAEVDGLPVEGTWRAHQVPIAEARHNDDHREPARGLDAQLPPGGAVRRGRGAGAARSRRSRPPAAGA